MAKHVRVTVEGIRGVPWAGQFWAPGMTDVDVDDNVAADLAKAPISMRVEWVDCEAPEREFSVVAPPPTASEKLAEAERRCLFFQAHAEQLEHKLALLGAGSAQSSTEAAVAAAVDTLRARHAVQVEELQARVERAETERDRLLEKATAPKTSEPFVEVPTPPAPPVAEPAPKGKGK